MPVSFTCPCGQHLEVEDEYAGMQVSCPTCRGVVTAPARPRRVVARPLAPPPAADPGFEVVDAPPRKPAPRPRPVDDEDDDRPRRRRRDEEEDPEDRRARLRYLDTEKPRSYESRLLSGSVIGGAVAMAVAVVWFVAGLAVGIIFFYPPILFVLGLIGFIHGVIKGRE